MTHTIPVNKFSASNLLKSKNVLSRIYFWNMCILACLRLVCSYPRVVQELYLYCERDRNSHMGHQAMWLTAMHSGSDVTIRPNCVAVHDQTWNRKMQNCIKRFTCVCVYGFNVWSHDKAKTGNCVCVCSAIILSITMETCFILFASGCMSRREPCHFHPIKCPCQRLLKSSTTCTIDSHTFPMAKHCVISKPIRNSY